VSLEARFHLQRGTFTLDAAFCVPASGVTAVFGPSGCGKTSLLRAVAGLERCKEGYLKIGDDVWQAGTRFVAPHHRALGYVFQEASLFPHLSVRRNLEYGYRRVPVGDRRMSFDQAVDLLGLESLLVRQPAHLSGGERQRVAIARALLTSPRLMLMDEPLASLDAKRKADLLPFIERLHEELTMPVLFVSHAPDEVARLADHLLLLEAGKVLADGPINDVLTRFDLPLAHDQEAGAIIEATVSGYDETYHLTRLKFAGGEFTLAREVSPPGRRVRLRVLARDVSLTLAHQPDTSILNILPACVEALVDESKAQLMVRLSVGGSPLLARITRKSATVLALAPGKAVFAQVKSVALLG